jgi:MoxR-like ATPase
VTVMVQGEPGIGKSAVGKAVADLLGFHFAYMDMANMSLGDLTLPVANRELHCAEFYPNEVLHLHSGKPVVVMMDEWTKAGKEVKNMTLPLALERRLGSIKLHPDSIVFATGNLAGDGVGDSIQAHQLNRFITVTQRKPSAEEWINNYAVANGIEPVVMAFVDQFPQVLESYKDDKDGTNKYIFNPKRQQGAYVSPRSLKFASDIIKQRANVSGSALHAALSGAIGPAAAADLVSFVNMNEQLPPFAAIVADPKKTALPKEPVNRLLLTFNLIMRVDKDTMPPVLQYVERLNKEMQGLFLNKILSAPSKATWAAKVPALAKMCVANQYLFS